MMDDFPKPIQAYLSGWINAIFHPAYIRVDEQLRLIDWRGDFQSLGYPPLQRGAPIADQIELFEGLLPLEDSPFILPQVKFNTGASADLHFVKHEKETYVVILHAASIEQRIQPFQQRANEIELLKIEIERINQDLKQFTRIVSHDLKAPLRSIQSLAAWIEDDLRDSSSSEISDNLELLVKQTQRMEQIIEGLLQYSRAGVQQERVEDVDLHELIGEILGWLSPPDHIEVTVDSHLPIVRGDRIRLQQIFQNLIDNAIRYNDKAQGKIRIYGEQDHQGWTFGVLDNGPGIDAGHHQDVFKIFHRLPATRAKQGTGIGLATVKKIIDQCQGRIWIESSQEEGAAFYFTLPLLTHHLFNRPPPPSSAL